MVLYRKYRPQTLSELVGQEHVKKTLLFQLNSGKISHAYLFTGPKGTGKTTTARILAKAVNCQSSIGNSKTQQINDKRNTINVFSEPCNQCHSCTAILEDRHIDVIEIDAASNRGIDDVRNLRESIKLAPAVSRFKVYIVDEVHMLTTEAANALLKTLEEPPPHAIFVLATTSPEKMLQTIISRCQVFNFFPATRAQIVENLQNISKAESRNLTDGILTKIAEKSEGSYRDAQVYLEKVLVQDNLDEKTLIQLLAGVDFPKLSALAQKLAEKNAKEAILQINDLVEQGISAQVINSEFLNFLRQILFVKVGVADSLNLPADNLQVLLQLSAKFTQGQILELIKLFENATNTKNTPIAQLPAELAIVQYCLASPKS